VTEAVASQRNRSQNVMLGVLNLDRGHWLSAL
jgi:hypothetical protein